MLRYHLPIILILGTGDSGKSTFVKQIELIYKDGFDQTKRNLYKTSIQNNLLVHTQRLIQGANGFGLEFKDENLEIARILLKLNKTVTDNEDYEPEELFDMIKTLWDDESIKDTFRRRSSLQIPDAAEHFLNDIDRIGNEDYVPSDKDILYCRIPTVGIKEVSFKVNNYPWKLVDVGGQRSERRKWIHQFEHVTVLIYVVAISEYDQKLYEDESINRMIESYELLYNTANTEIFLKTNCVILFNKMDIFEEKIKSVDPICCFSEYDGGFDYEKSKKFITDKFIDVATNKSRKIFPFYTIATETSTIKKVFDNIQSKILEEHMNTLGLIEKI
ncbi:guanine nucleotide-binding protein g(o) subunit alpha [Anaeramoeba flamelloides]|uniref:Guanine nucleotide-binding protein g(O) subunit alpha n=1 Tax=Anaeramoeba flamelloides TaxID=1746091 RepID=A0ABQ8YS66_9EUKA|nr:guanine nucleotide-binding protein g(o) subunit alpha [Anaeramoeba flamelloides]